MAGRSNRMYRDAEVKAEIKRKELGFVSRFLDAVWANLGNTGAMAVGIAGGWGILEGGVSPFMIPTALLAGVVPTAATALGRGFDDAWKARVHDGPRCQELIAEVRSRAAGIVAAQRGSVWIVFGTGTRKPRVMGDVEYAAFRKGWFARGLALDEVTIERKRITAARYVAGRLDAGGRALPVRETFDTREGRSVWTDWFGDRGRAPKEVEAFKRNHPFYRATRYLAGGAGTPDANGPETVAPRMRRHYRASRFLSGGSGHEDTPTAGHAVPVG